MDRTPPTPPRPKSRNVHAQGPDKIGEYGRVGKMEVHCPIHIYVFRVNPSAYRIHPAAGLQPEFKKYLTKAKTYGIILSVK